MKLYSYWRSTTSFRVRAALNLKGIAYDIEPIDLLKGDQRGDAFAKMNPGKGVPALALTDGTVLTQSLAILNWLEAKFPNPRLIPVEVDAQAKVLAAAHTLALDVHPVNNLRVVAHLKQTYGFDAQQINDWMCHWMSEGLIAYEAQIDPNTPFSFGNTPDWADLCLVAQLYNAHRWGLDLSPFPKVQRVETACLSLSAIMAAHPDKQPDANPS